MTYASDTTTSSHTYTYALPTSGAASDCQPGHNPAVNPWTQASGELYEDQARNRPLGASPFRPGGRHRMFTRVPLSDLLREEQRALQSEDPRNGHIGASSLGGLAVVEPGCAPAVNLEEAGRSLADEGQDSLHTPVPSSPSPFR